MEFRLLGPVRALADGHPLTLGGPKQRALLAELLLHAGAVVPRDRLIDALWGEHVPPSARSSLQVYVHGLRRVLGADRIETHGTGYRIAVNPDEIDAARFERLVGAAERALAGGRAAEAVDDLERAIALWEGPPLSDVVDHPVAAAAFRLNELRLHALELRNDARLELGEHEAVVPSLQELVAAEPYRERLREQLARALYQCGRQQDALEALRCARATLVEELGLDPSPTLTELERAILRQDTGLAAPPAPRRRDALPSPPTPLIGRRLEIAAVAAILRRDSVRLVTLTGPGGSGKTRLALAVAEAMAPEVRDGAVFVDVSAVTTPEQVLPAVAQAFEVPADGVLDELRRLSLLLVLDNLEQLGAAVAPVNELLTAAPRVRILATSRAPLRLRAEHEYPVPTLPVPEPTADAEALTANDAVRLFVAMAQAARPAYAPADGELGAIGSICRALDGLPLALELAAARIRALSAVEIEQRLDSALGLLVSGPRDLPARQQTLRATLDWSYRLLAPTEQRLLAELATFVGGFRLADAEAVTAGDAARSLVTLVEHGLVRRRGERFAMLETIREYALEKLVETGDETNTRARHCAWFLQVAEAAYRELLTGGEAETHALALLDRDHENLHAAIEWTLDAGEVAETIRFCAALRWYWLVRARFAEGLDVFERVAAVTGDRPALQAAALLGAGLMNVRRGEYARARGQIEQALDMFKATGDESEIARCTAELGHALVELGELDQAEALYVEAVENFTRLGEHVRAAVALANVGAIAANRGDYNRAEDYAERAIAMQRQLDDQDGVAVSLANLGRVRLELNDEEGARSAFRESFAIGMRLDYQMLLAYLLGAAAEVARRAGEDNLAVQLVGAAGALFESIGMRVTDEERAEHQRTLAAASVDDVNAELRAGAAASTESMLEVAAAVFGQSAAS